jgi:transcriptional regulator with XRE-family HTH domain
LSGKRPIYPHPDYPKELKTLGDHIRKVRLNKKLTQLELGKIMGVSETSINMWEKQNRFPNISRYPPIIKFLGYDPLYLSDGSVRSKLENYRRKHGLTYKQVARIAGIGNETMYNFIRGENVQERTINKILKTVDEAVSD